jgi:hypothetical protein
MMKAGRAVALVGATALPAIGAGCEESFKKSGNALVGSSYNAFVTVGDLTAELAVSQLRAIATQRGLDVLTEDAANGSMLLEQRESVRNKPIPYVIALAPDGPSIKIQLLVKLGKGALAKAEDVRGEMCAILGQVKGGEEGRALASRAASASDQPRQVDAQVLSDELARQMKDSAVSIPLRYKDKQFTISGRVKYVNEDFGTYRVAYDIRDQRDRILKSGDAEVQLSCLVAPSHRAWAIALRPGERVKLTGVFANFSQFERVMWLKDCRPE